MPFTMKRVSKEIKTMPEQASAPHDARAHIEDAKTRKAARAADVMLVADASTLCKHTDRVAIRDN